MIGPRAVVSTDLSQAILTGHSQVKKERIQYNVSIRSLFGYIGFVGVAGLLFIFFAVLWHHLRKAISQT